MRKILRFPLIRLAIRILKRIRLPGFRGVGLYYVLEFFFKELGDPYFTLRASAIAYNFFFAIFPALIFILTLIPYIPIGDLKSEFIMWLNTVFPADSFSMVHETVEDIVNRSNGGLISISVFLALFSSTRGIMVMMNAFSKNSHEGYKKITVLKSRLWAALTVLILIILLIISLTILVGGEWAIGYFQEMHLLNDTLSIIALRTLNLVVTLGVLLAFFSVIYTLVPQKHERWGLVTPGGILGATLTLLAFIAFGLFIGSFGNYNKIYGSLSAIILLMVWFYWIALVILIGYELNVAIERAEKRRTSGSLSPILATEGQDNNPVT